MATGGSTVAEALRIATAQLSEGSDTARLDAEILMAHALGVPRSDMLLHHMREPAPPEFWALVARRAAHEPVAYITGEQEFYGRSFLVTPEVLIPRADSETVVELALREGDIIAADGHEMRVLDLGAGSGALLLSVLAERPQWHGVGVDRSLGALSVAAANAARLVDGARARIVRRDWHEGDWRDGLGQFDLIVANPPYVETGADLTADVRDYEPSGALFAGADGLDDYRRLIPQIGALLSQGGAAVLEIGASQAEAVREIARQNGFLSSVTHDLGGRPRAIGLTSANNTA